MLPIFQLEINDPTENEALISQSLVCNVTGIVKKVEEFQQQISVTQGFNCQSFGHSAKNCRSKIKCLICGESRSHKGCPNKEDKKPKCTNCKGPHVASYKGKGVLSTKSRHSDSNGQQPKIICHSIEGQNSLPQPKTQQTFSFTAEQLTKFVANVAIQIAQPQVCYPNPKQDTLDLKFSMCRKISNAARQS